MRPLPGDNQERKTVIRPRFGEALKHQFREAVRAITHKIAPPEPSPRRRRKGEDTGRAFRMAGAKILRRAVHIPVEVFTAASGYLHDTLEWLNLWQQNAVEDGFDEDFERAPQDHLYPHL